MHYDSGGSFGFSYIGNGAILRFRYSLSTDEVTKDFGFPLDEELNILNGTIFHKIIDLNEREYLYARADDKEKLNSYNSMNSDLTNEVMKAKIGFGLYDDNLRTKIVYVTLKNISKAILEEKKVEVKKSFLGRLFDRK